MFNLYLILDSLLLIDVNASIWYVSQSAVGGLVWKSIAVVNVEGICRWSITCQVLMIRGVFSNICGISIIYFGSGHIHLKFIKSLLLESVCINWSYIWLGQKLSKILICCCSSWNWFTGFGPCHPEYKWTLISVHAELYTNLCCFHNNCFVQIWYRFEIVVILLQSNIKLPTIIILFETCSAVCSNVIGL